MRAAWDRVLVSNCILTTALRPTLVSCTIRRAPKYDSEITVYACELSPADVAAAAAGGGAGAVAAATVNLTLASATAQAWTVFANGEMVGTGWELSHRGGTASITVPVPLPSIRPPLGQSAGATSTLLVLVSTSLGIDNGGGVKNGE